jgi:hypothetical protein
VKRLVGLVVAAACGASAPPPSKPPPVTATTAVEAEIGLDLRALPTGTSPDQFVLGQGQDIRDLAPSGVDIEIRHVPGAGVLYAVFRSPANDARAACAQVIGAYLAHAPKLPVVMTSAAQLVTPCHDIAR